MASVPQWEEKLSPCQRVRRALHFGAPDRLPLCFRNDPALSDVISVWYSHPADWLPAAAGVDEWGIGWQNVIGTGCGQIVFEPLSATADVSRYRFPEPHACGRYDGVEAALAAYPDRYIAGCFDMSGFSRMMSLRGFENLLCDMHVDRAFVNELAEGVFAFEAGVIREYARRGVHGVWLFDDLATQRGPFISPALFRQVLMPRFEAQAALVHALGMDYLLHSCGNVWDLIPDLIKAGFDLLNLEQPLVFSTEHENGIDRLARCYGGRVCFCTNVDSQRTLVFGTVHDVVDEAEHIVRALSRPEGGLIPLADCGAGHLVVAPPENIVAMKATFLRLAGRARTVADPDDRGAV
ncbi:MAG: uroporphyrinogen decarboxylase family protein [Anaerolineae bacterium]